MHRSLKHLKFTFTSISLVILLCISLVLFVAQLAFAQTNSPATVPLETRAAVQAELRANTATGTVPLQARAAVTAPANGPRNAALPELRADAEARKEAFVLRQTERKAAVEAKRAALATTSVDRIARLEAAAQERITERAAHATERLTAVIEKLEGFIERLNERAEMLAAAGADTAEAEETLLSALDILARAENALADIDVEIEFAVTSGTPRTDWAEAREQFIAVRDLVKEAHTLIREAVTALKGAAVAADMEHGVSAAVRADRSTTTSTSAE